MNGQTFNTGSAALSLKNWVVTVKKRRRGIYVKDFFYILGDEERENELLDLVKNKNFDYITLFDLNDLWLQEIAMERFDSQEDVAEHLAQFISKAKNSFGVLEIGAAGQTNAFFDKVLNFNNESNAKFDFLTLEFEYWLSDTSDFSAFESVLIHMRNIADSNSLKVEVYIGFPASDTEALRIAELADRIFNSFLYNGRKFSLSICQKSSVFVWDTQ